MPDKKTKVTLGNQEVDAVRVEVVSSSENFNTYTLEDGTTIKLKTVVVEILKAVGVEDSEGRPVYAIKSQNVLFVE